MVPYSISIFPYWHYVERGDMPTKHAKYMIFLDDVNARDQSYMPRFEIATYVPEQDMWRLRDGALYPTKALQIVAWQDLPCLPKGRKQHTPEV